VRVGGEVGESFWTGRELRQGCPLSPILFNILIADLEEEMGRVRWGGVKLGGKKIYSLAYADRNFIGKGGNWKEDGNDGIWILT